MLPSLYTLRRLELTGLVTHRIVFVFSFPLSNPSLTFSPPLAALSLLGHTGMLTFDIGKDEVTRIRQILMVIGVVDGTFLLSRKLDESYDGPTRHLSHEFEGIMYTLALQYDVRRMSLNEPVWRG